MVPKAAAISRPASAASSAASASMSARSSAGASASAFLLIVVVFFPRAAVLVAAGAFFLRPLFIGGAFLVLDRRMFRRPQDVERLGVARPHHLAPFRLALDELVVRPAVGAAPAHVDRLA